MGDKRTKEDISLIAEMIHNPEDVLLEEDELEEEDEEMEDEDEGEEGEEEEGEEEEDEEGEEKPDFGETPDVETPGAIETSEEEFEGQPATPTSMIECYADGCDFHDNENMGCTRDDIKVDERGACMFYKSPGMEIADEERGEEAGPTDESLIDGMAAEMGDEEFGGEFDAADDIGDPDALEGPELDGEMPAQLGDGGDEPYEEEEEEDELEEGRMPGHRGVRNKSNVASEEGDVPLNNEAPSETPPPPMGAMPGKRKPGFKNIGGYRPEGMGE